MTKKKTDPFINLSWDDLREWAGSKIVSRGRSYQCQNLVSKLAISEDGGLLAWVDGTHRYATYVTINEGCLPESICTCPYGCDCKHGVAVVLEYLEQVENNQRVPKVNRDDERFLLLYEDDWDEDIENGDDYDYDESILTQKVKSEITDYLKDKTKTQLTELIFELAGKFPQLVQELTDRKQIASGDFNSLIKRLKKDIREISSEPGWQNYWQNEGYTPDYSEICIKLETLLNAGYADEVLMLGKELIDLGNRQVEQSHDEGETAMEIEECMPVILEALEKSSMDKADKLAWALDVVLKDDYDIFDVFNDYLYRRHAKADWNILAERLLKQLGKMKNSGVNNNFHRNYARDQLSDWVIHALEQAGRDDEVIPLCEAEAQRTGSFSRLVKHLISEKRYSDAEQWINEGIRATDKQLPGISSDLRQKLKEIRILQKDWAAVAIMQTEEFVCHPSRKTFIDCQKAHTRTKTWPKARDNLLIYLEKGHLPWKQEGWPLGKPTQAEPVSSYRNRFPMTDVLIDIAIQEKEPKRVLFWYDQLQSNKRGWAGIDDNQVAVAIQDYAPERAISIWKTMAEALISQTKPSAYEQAASFLSEAEKIVKREKKQAEWNHYLNGLKEKHARKRRLIEILEQSGSRPIIKER